MKKDKKNNSIENCNKKVGYNSNDLHNQLDTNEVTNKTKNNVTNKSNNNVTDCGK